MSKENDKKLAVLKGEVFSREKETKGRQVIIGTLNVFAPPLAAKYHGRYENRRKGHLILDTILALIIFVLIVLNVFYFTSGDLLPSPSIQATLSGPETVSSGEVIEFTLSLKNPGESNLNTIKIEFSYPEDFEYQSASQEPSNQQNNLWQIEKIEGGQSFDLTVSGQTLNDINSSSMVKVLVYYSSGDETYDKSEIYLYQTTGSTLVASWLGTDETVGSESYILNLVLKNTGAETLQDIKVTVTPPSDYVFLTGVVIPNNILEINIDELEAGKEWSTGLHGKSAEAEQNRVDTFSAQVTASGKLIADSEYKVTIKPEKTAEELITGNTQTGTETLEFVAETHYFSSAGVQFGYGPIPPQVGELTGYRIFWTIKNNQELTSADVKAQLPENVVWVGNASVSAGQNISYDSNTRTVTWPIGSIENNQQTLTASFEVQITPIVSDVGNTITLLGQSALTAMKGGSTLTKSFSSVTTDLNEALGQGKGVVVE